MGLLDHFGYDDALFVGHDWGAIVVWNLAMMHRKRVAGVINMSVPFMERGPTEWVGFWEQHLGGDFYIVHFNRQPGVADAVLDAHTDRFLRNLFRKNLPPAPPEPGMMMINLATATAPLGDPVMSDEDLAVFIAAFDETGFTGSINWYRNMDRNWHILADVDPIVRHPALMIYGTRDMIPPSENLVDFVPNVEVLSLDSGHWIQQEKPEKTTQAMLDWLAVRQAA